MDTNPKIRSFDEYRTQKTESVRDEGVPGTQEDENEWYDDDIDEVVDFEEDPYFTQQQQSFHQPLHQQMDTMYGSYFAPPTVKEPTTDTRTATIVGCGIVFIAILMSLTLISALVYFILATLRMLS